MTNRNLLLVGLLLVFGLGVVAPSAMAQALPVGVTTTEDVLRPNSNGDALGPITLTFGAASSFQSGQIFTFTYSQAITGASGVSSQPVADFCTSNAGLCADFTISASGSMVTMTAIAGGPFAVVATDYIIISGFRASTYGLPASTGVTALVYAANTISGTPVTFPIIFGNGTNSIPVTVGYVGSTTAVTYAPPSSPGSVSTCIGLITPGPAQTWTMSITENWAGAWTSKADESTLAGYLVTNGSNLAITVTNIPDTVTVTPPLATAITNTGGIAAWTLPANQGTTFSAPSPTTYTSTADGSSATFTYTIVTTERAVPLLSTPLNQPPEGAKFPFTLSSPGALHTGLAAMAVSVQLAPPPATSAPFVYPAFTYPVLGLAEEEPGTPQAVFTFVDCVSHLMWPYVTNYTGGVGPLGNWDTAIEVANATSVPWTTTVSPQKGACTFYYYSAGTSTAPGPGAQAGTIVPPTTTPYLNSGGIFAFMLSNGTYGAPGLVGGYAVATCGFQNAVGYGAIVDNATGIWQLYANYLAFGIN